VNPSALLRAKGWGQAMIHRVPAAPAPDLARMASSLTKSICGRSWCGLALACLLLASCAGMGGNSPQATDQTSQPKVDAAAARAASGGAGAVAADPGLLQRRRQAIAEMLEANIYYRTALNVKLVDAKFAGPNVRIIRNLFSTSTSEDRYYCATARMVFPYLPLPVPKTAVIRVRQAENGSEYLQATIEVNGTRYECIGKDINYLPFPELEQLRAKRRQALGKSD
jgi:hypothetical protein